MSNNLLSAFAIVTVIGFSAALLPRLAAPSDSYISDSLAPTEEPFYFVDNPDSVVINSGDPLFLSASTNLADCDYSWEYKPVSSLTWYSAPSIGISMSGYYYHPSYFISNSIFRCKAIYNNMTIYSSPCFVSVIQSSKGLEKFGEFQELEEPEEPEELEESEKIEAIEEIERGVENAE